MFCVLSAENHDALQKVCYNQEQLGISEEDFFNSQF